MNKSNRNVVVNVSQANLELSFLEILKSWNNKRNIQPFFFAYHPVITKLSTLDILTEIHEPIPGIFSDCSELMAYNNNLNNGL